VRHLTAQELIDLAEGERVESNAPHLAACAECRARIAELRATLRTAADVGVPEPSPLFWDHFSARVSNAIADERSRKPKSIRWLRIFVPAALTAAAAVGIFMSLRQPALPKAVRPADKVAVRSIDSSVEPTSELATDSSPRDDASLSLVGDLAAAIDLDAAFDAGMTPDGTAEHAVTHLDIDELRELRRLLQHELGVI
jgi:hypothetical protein